MVTKTYETNMHKNRKIFLQELLLNKESIMLSEQESRKERLCNTDLPKPPPMRSPLKVKSF